MEELTSSVTGRAMAGEPTRPALNTAKVEAIIGKHVTCAYFKVYYINCKAQIQLISMRI